MHTYILLQGWNKRMHYTCQETRNITILNWNNKSIISLREIHITLTPTLCKVLFLSLSEASNLHLHTDSEDESRQILRDLMGRRGYQMRNKIASQGQRGIQERWEEKDKRGENGNWYWWTWVTFICSSAERERERERAKEELQMKTFGE